MKLDQTSADELFSRAVGAFKDSIPRAEKADFQKFQRPEAMLEELRLLLLANHVGRVDSAFRKVATFSSALGSYFDVVNTFMQIHPEYTGLFWGSVLLVCKLGSNYAGFFEKTADMLTGISQSLPQYRDYLEICSKREGIDSNRLVTSLAFVYADIVDFCKQIYVMLRRGGRDATAKFDMSLLAGRKWVRRVSFIGDVAWKPFDQRFKGLLERLRRHERVFLEEMKIHDSKMLNKLELGQKTLNILDKGLQTSINGAFQKLDEDSEQLIIERAKGAQLPQQWPYA